MSQNEQREQISQPEQTSQREQISKKRVVYTMPGSAAVTVRRNEPYRARDGSSLTMDLYYPPNSSVAARTPVVILVTGYSDRGAQGMLGCNFKDMGAFVSWAGLIAACGLVAVTYANQNPDDVYAVLDHVQLHASSLGIDGSKIGVWACSGHGPNALSVLIEAGRSIACATLAYAYTLDLDGATDVADAAKQFRFVTPAAGKSASDLPRELPLFIVRAGLDATPGLNDALDRFVTAALVLNVPITVVNHASGAHAFDLFEDSRASCEVVKQVLAFLQFHLSV